MNILAVSGSKGGCLAYRVLLPLNQLQKAGHKVSLFATEKRQRMAPETFRDTRVVILQKQTDPNWVKMIRLTSGASIIYEVDDLLWGMDESHPGYQEWIGRNREGAIACMERSDLVTCTTPELAEEIKKVAPRIGSRVRVIPNFIDFGYRDWSSKMPRTYHGVTIGWFGGWQHFGDEKPCANAVRRVVEENSDCRFLFIGDKKLWDEWSKSFGPHPRIQFQEPRPFETCPQLLSLLDIGIAPLADTPFNRCKSDLKLLEYGAHKVPWVASDIAPYRRYDCDTEFHMGFLAKTEEAWFASLSYLVSNSEERKSMGETGFGLVRSERSPDRCLEAWSEVISEVS